MGGLGLGAILLIYFTAKTIGQALDSGKEAGERRWTDVPGEEERSAGSVLGELVVAALIGATIALLVLVFILSSI